MRVLKVRRAIAAAGVVAAAVMVPVAAAAPASASPSHCVSYLSDKGYIIGPKVRDACQYATITYMPLCQAKLESIGVRSEHNFDACYYRW